MTERRVTQPIFWVPFQNGMTHEAICLPVPYTIEFNVEDRSYTAYYTPLPWAVMTTTGASLRSVEDAVEMIVRAVLYGHVCRQEAEDGEEVEYDVVESWTGFNDA